MKTVRLFNREPWGPGLTCTTTNCRAGWILEGNDARPCRCPVGRRLRVANRRGEIPDDAHNWEPLEITGPRLEAIVGVVTEWGRGFVPGESAGLLFLGAPGAGKTRMAGALAAFLLEEGRARVRWRDWPEFLRRVQSTYKVRPGEVVDSEETLIAEALDGDLLVIDDLGAEHSREGSGWAEGLLCDVLNRALKASRPSLVITSNLGGQELRRRYGDRVFGRIEELCRADKGGKIIPFDNIRNYRAGLVEVF